MLKTKKKTSKSLIFLSKNRIIKWFFSKNVLLSRNIEIIDADKCHRKILDLNAISDSFDIVNIVVDELSKDEQGLSKNEVALYLIRFATVFTLAHALVKEKKQKCYLLLELPVLIQLKISKIINKTNQLDAYSDLFDWILFIPRFILATHFYIKRNIENLYFSLKNIFFITSFSPKKNKLLVTSKTLFIFGISDSELNFDNDKLSFLNFIKDTFSSNKNLFSEIYFYSKKKIYCNYGGVTISSYSSFNELKIKLISFNFIKEYLLFKLKIFIFPFLRFGDFLSIKSTVTSLPFKYIFKKYSIKLTIITNSSLLDLSVKRSIQENGHIILLNYAMFTTALPATFDKEFIDISLKYSCFDYTLTWNKEQENYFINMGILKEKIRQVGPIIFSGRQIDRNLLNTIFNDSKAKKVNILLFDISAFSRESFLSIEGYPPSLYSKENLISFYEDIIQTCEKLYSENFNLLIKIKRSFSFFHDKDYINYVSNLKKRSFQITILSYDLNPWYAVICADAVICVPYTSPAYLAQYLQIPSCYYHSLKGMLKPFGHLVEGKEELESWMSAQVRHIDNKLNKAQNYSKKIAVVHQNIFNALDGINNLFNES